MGLGMVVRAWIRVGGGGKELQKDQGNLVALVLVEQRFVFIDLYCFPHFPFIVDLFTQ